MEEKYKKRMVECFGYSDEDKSMKRWKQIKSPRRVLKNYLIMVACRFLPDIPLKYRSSARAIFSGSERRR